MYIYGADKQCCWPVDSIGPEKNKQPIREAMSFPVFSPQAAFNLFCGAAPTSRAMGPRPAHLLECEMSIYAHNKRYATARPPLPALLFEPNPSLSLNTQVVSGPSFPVPLPNIQSGIRKSRMWCSRVIFGYPLCGFSPCILNYNYRCTDRVCTKEIAHHKFSFHSSVKY